MQAETLARRAAHAVVARRRVVVAAWLVAVAAAAPWAARVDHVLDVAARVRGSESARVDSLVVARFASPFASSAVVVASGLPADSAAHRATLHRIVARVRAMPGVVATLSALDGSDAIFPRAGPRTFIVVGLAGGAGAADSVIPRLRAASARLSAELPTLQLRWTGEQALNVDIRRASAEDASAGEMRALPITLLLLLVAFGGAVAASLPVAAGVVTITITLGIAAIAARISPLSILLENVVTMLGLGLGVDYALLMVSRMREELRGGGDASAAAERALCAAGRTIVLSAGTVLVGFAALSVVPLDDLRAVAVGGAIVVAVAALAAVTLLPALLAMLGRRIDALSIRSWTRAPRRARSISGPSSASASESRAWERWARAIVRRPLIALTLGAAPLMLLVLPLRRIDTRLPRTGWLPARMESAVAIRELEAMGQGGVAQSIRLVVLLPEGVHAYDPAAWRAVQRLVRPIAADPRVGRVQSLPTLVEEQLGVTTPSLGVVALLPATVPPAFVSRDQRLAAVEIVPRSIADYDAVTALARDLRRLDPDAATALPGTRLLVGGMPAFNADYEDAVRSALPRVVALVVGATLLALLVGFRSLLVPVKAITLNLLSVAASLGATVLVFQEGRAPALGGGDALGGLFPALPLLVFCVVFGLSMDYEIFLVARVAEARRAGAGEHDAIVAGVAHTGGVITSAAAVMIAVFAAFATGGFVIVRILGFALAVAVLLDATIVRLVVGPALFALAGRWNWWPGDRARYSINRRGLPMRSALSASRASASSGSASHSVGIGASRRFSSDD